MTHCPELSFKKVQKISLTSKAALEPRFPPLFLTVHICIPICCPSSNSLCESLGVSKKLWRMQAAITSMSTLSGCSLSLRVWNTLHLDAGTPNAFSTTICAWDIRFLWSCGQSSDKFFVGKQHLPLWWMAHHWACLYQAKGNLVAHEGMQLPSHVPGQSILLYHCPSSCLSPTTTSQFPVPLLLQ